MVVVLPAPLGPQEADDLAARDLKADMNRRPAPGPKNLVTLSTEIMPHVLLLLEKKAAVSSPREK